MPLVATKRRPMDYGPGSARPPSNNDLHARLGRISRDGPEGLLLTDEIRETVNRAIENLPEDLAARQSCCASWKD